MCTVSSFCLPAPGVTNFEIVDAVDGRNASIPDSEVKRWVLTAVQSYCTLRETVFRTVGSQQASGPHVVPDSGHMGRPLINNSVIRAARLVTTRVPMGMQQLPAAAAVLCSRSRIHKGPPWGCPSCLPDWQLPQQPLLHWSC